MIGNSWDDCLPESHREALHDSLCLLGLTASSMLTWLWDRCEPEVHG